MLKLLPQFLQNIGSSLMSLRNGMRIDYQGIDHTTVQSASGMVLVLTLVPSTGYLSQSWMHFVHTLTKTWQKGSFATQNLWSGTILVLQEKNGSLHLCQLPRTSYGNDPQSLPITIDSRAFGPPPDWKSFFESRSTRFLQLSVYLFRT